MATITSTGLGSGLDIESLVSSLMSVEKRPLLQLATKEASYQAKLSAFGQIKSVLSELRTATTALNDASKFSATGATVTGDAGFTASSTSGAATGSYGVEVFSLAKVQRIATSATNEISVTAPGNLTITYGEVDAGGAFVADPDPDRSATLEFTGSTLEELRDAINANSKLGIKASIVDNGEARQLVLTGTATGADKAFKLSGDGGLAALSYTPGIAGDLETVQAASDAKLKVDGIAITRASNTITDVIEGVTLTLNKEPEGAATSLKGTVSVSANQTSAKTAIEAFVQAYNAVTATLKGLTNYDAENETAATLTGDSTARSITGQLRASLNTSFNTLEGATSLSQIGLSFQKDGTLLIDGTKLNAALSNPDKKVGELFSGIKADEDNDIAAVAGFAEVFNKKLDSFLNSSEGLIASRTKGISATIASITKQYDAMETRLEGVEARYRKQFTALDSLISQLSQTSTYLSQQLANLPKIGNSSN